MSFMQPEIYETDYIEIDGPMGGEIIPCDAVNYDPCTCGFSKAPTASAHEHHQSCATQDTNLRDVPRELRAYTENRLVWSIERKHGFVGRMSASGYMDATEWSACDTEKQMREYLIEMYGEEE